MATTNSTIETPSLLSNPKWPNEPEGLLTFIPDDLNGSPLEMLTGLLIRTHGVIALLCAEFMGDGNYRPTDSEMVGVLWTAQSQLELARELLERLDTVEATDDSDQDELFTSE